jgi:hypothetical protein
MINTQIINYIKVELEKKTDVQTITNSLIANGWNASDIQEAFSSINPVPVAPRAASVPPSSVPVTPNPTVVYVKENIWVKTVSTTNVVYLVLYVLFLVFADYPTYQENPSRYGSFWMMMLYVFCAWVLFALFEQFVLKNSFKNTSSSVDGTILAVINLRNILVLLNLIPFIQIIGILVGYVAAPIIIVSYIILIVTRYMKKPPVQTTQVVS